MQFHWLVVVLVDRLTQSVIEAGIGINLPTHSSKITVACAVNMLSAK